MMKKAGQRTLAPGADLTPWAPDASPDPELLAIPIETVRGWMAESPALAVYRFAIEDLYRQQEHVLDEKGERLLSLEREGAARIALTGPTVPNLFDDVDPARASCPITALSSRSLLAPTGLCVPTTVSLSSLAVWVIDQVSP